MKKIIVEARLLGRSTGIGVFFTPYLNQLIKDFPDTEFILVTVTKNSLQQYRGYSNVQICLLSLPGWLKRPYLIDLYYGLFIFPFFLRSQQADLLLSPYYDFLIPGKFVGKTVIGVLDLCYLDRPNLYRLHTLIPSKFFLKRALSSCAGVITVSETSRERLEFHFPQIIQKKDVLVAYCCFFRPNSEPSSSLIPQEISKFPGRKILYSGGFENRKNLDRFFEAFRLVLKENEDLTLVVTGNLRHNNKFNTMLARHGVLEKVLLTGVLSTEQMEALYLGGVSGAVNVSLCEGFGINSYEAILYGLPLLCSDIEVNREVAGDYPIYCDPMNVEDIARGIQSLICKSRGFPLQSVDSRFQAEPNISKFLNFIQECMK